MMGVWFFVGVGVGLWNGFTLWRVVHRMEPDRPRRSRMRVASSRWLRWTGVAVLLILALQRGIVPGLLAFAGLWCARWVLVGWWAWGRRPSRLLRE